MDLGAVRIAADGGQFRVRTLPAVLEKLPPKSASLGESLAYYRGIGSLPSRLRTNYLSTLRDIVAKPSRRERITDSSLWEKSFLREASSRHALKRGGIDIGSHVEEVEPPAFKFSMTLPGAAGPHVIDFDFSSKDGLPGRRYC